MMVLEASLLRGRIDAGFRFLLVLRDRVFNSDVRAISLSSGRVGLRHFGERYIGVGDCRSLMFRDKILRRMRSKFVGRGNTRVPKIEHMTTVCTYDPQSPIISFRHSVYRRV